MPVGERRHARPLAVASIMIMQLIGSADLDVTTWMSHVRSSTLTTRPSSCMPAAVATDARSTPSTVPARARMMSEERSLEEAKTGA